MKVSVVFSTAAVLAAVLVPVASRAQERKIPMSALPAAVQKTVQQQSQGATVKGFSTEREHGQKVYEAEMMVNGHSKDIQIGEDGTLNEVEEEVVFASLPAKVQAALTAKAGGGTLGKIESLTKQGKLVAYEAVVKSGVKSHEIQVGPNGEKLLKEE